MSERGGRREASRGLQTEYQFTLPKGYVDHEGTLHREGTMRLLDEMSDHPAVTEWPRKRSTTARAAR